eukprot:COSAG02_NODE_5911_length_3942_cov_2.643247_6_plen_109_part_00
MGRRTTTGAGIVEAWAVVRTTTVCEPPIDPHWRTGRVVRSIAIIQVLPEDADSEASLLKMRCKVPLWRVYNQKDSEFHTNVVKRRHTVCSKSGVKLGERVVSYALTEG